MREWNPSHWTTKDRERISKMESSETSKVFTAGERAQNVWVNTGVDLERQSLALEGSLNHL